MIVKNINETTDLFLFLIKMFFLCPVIQQKYNCCL